MSPAACAGNCADLPAVFATTPLLPYYPNGLQEYTCHQFPDDDVTSDTIIVALISIAIAIPVTVFLGSCFEIANDSDAPESWLAYGGLVRFVLGRTAHRRWHYTRGEQPPRFVRWYIRSADAPKLETLINLCHSLVAWLTCRPPPWVLEAQEAGEEEAAHVKYRARGKVAPDFIDEPVDAAPGEHGVTGDDAPPASSKSSSGQSALRVSAYKRACTAFGLLGVYATWAVFAWFIFVRDLPLLQTPPNTFAADFDACLALAPQTYGILIYRLLGKQAEQSFARSWGVSYGLNACTEWRDVAREALKGAIILAILETLYLTRNVHWLEEHVDYLRCAADHVALFVRALCATRVSLMCPPCACCSETLQPASTPVRTRITDERAAAHPAFLRFSEAAHGLMGGVSASIHA